MVFLDYPVDLNRCGGFVVVINRSQGKEKIHLELQESTEEVSVCSVSSDSTPGMAAPLQPGKALKIYRQMRQ